MLHTDCIDETILPLTTVQRGLWNAQKLGSGDVVFNIAEAIEIRGAIDVALFREALRRVSQETEAIRTLIIERNGTPYQLVTPRFDDTFPLIDVSHKPDPAASAMRWMMQELLEPVDLARGPLWVCVLFRTGPDHLFWYHRCHHIIGDGFSGGMIAQRVAVIYSALVAGEEPPPSGFGSLAALVENEASYRTSPRFAIDRAYWMKQLADPPPAVTLARRHAPSWGGLLRTTGYLSEARTSRLSESVRSLNISLPQVLTALVAAYYHRASGANDLVVKMPVSARMSGPMRRIPGMVANAVPLRIRFEPGMTLEGLFLEVGRLIRTALRHQCYRYEDLRHDLGYISQSQQICWLGVNIEPFNYRLRFGEHVATTHNLCNGSVEDLTVFVYDRSDEHGLRIDFDASPALYSREELATHQSRLLALIKAAPTHLQTPISEIPLDLLDGIPAPRAIRAKTAEHLAPTLPDLVTAQATRTPDAVAVSVQGEPSRTLTYGELEAQSTRIARGLGREGIGAGDIVAVAMSRAEMLPTALLGVLKAGAAYLLLDPSAAPELHANLLDDADPAAILILDQDDDRFKGTRIPCIVLDEINDLYNAMPQLPPPRPDAVAYVLYTCGGRAARPRGYNVAHWNLSGFLSTAVAELSPDSTDRFLATASSALGFGAFGIGGVELFVPLVTGARLVLAPDHATRDAMPLRELVCEAGITFTLSGEPQGRSVPARDDPQERRDGALLLGQRRPRKPTSFARLSWTPTHLAGSAGGRTSSADEEHAMSSYVSLLATPSERTGRWQPRMTF